MIISNLKEVEMAAKKKEKAAKAKAAFEKGAIIKVTPMNPKTAKPLSSMAFIRETVTEKPDIELDALVKAVAKAGYKTAEVSIRQEYRKTLRKLKADKPKAKPKGKKAIELGPDNCGLPEGPEEA